MVVHNETIFANFIVILLLSFVVDISLNDIVEFLCVATRKYKEEKRNCKSGFHDQNLVYRSCLILMKMNPLSE